MSKLCVEATLRRKKLICKEGKKENNIIFSQLKTNKLRTSRSNKFKLLQVCIRANYNTIV